MLSAAGQFGQEEAGALADISRAFLRGVTANSVDAVFLLTPERIPFAGLMGIENVVFSLVPTVIWPARPALLDGNELAILYGTARPGTTGSYMPAVGDGYRRGGWPGVALIYTFNALIYAAVLALCWTRKAKREWMIMLIWLSYYASSIWSATLLGSFYVALWIFPRQFIVFWGLRWLQDLLSFFSMKRKSSRRLYPLISNRLINHEK